MHSPHDVGVGLGDAPSHWQVAQLKFVYGGGQIDVGSLGSPVHSYLAQFCGVGLGVGDGLGEGLGDGLGDGLGEGLGVGLGVGLGDGLGVGLGDGLGVGLGDAPSHWQVTQLKFVYGGGQIDVGSFGLPVHS